jgi:hypothetical protein
MHSLHNPPGQGRSLPFGADHTGKSPVLRKTHFPAPSGTKRSGSGSQTSFFFFFLSTD